MINVERIFQINNEMEFENLSLEIFHFQYENIPVYRNFIHYLHINPHHIDRLTKIPFLPIEFFKSHNIITSGKKPEIIFESSGTTDGKISRHFVADLSLYEKSFSYCFETFYGNLHNYCLLALLPSYLERSGSSLVYMVNKLIKRTSHPMSGFYLNDYHKLISVLKELKSAEIPIILLGVSFALADLAEKYKVDLSEVIFMETGGMKGRRKEIVRSQLHDMLTKSFNVKHVHSEYGMTELLTQAYSKANGIFQCPPWMKIFIRDSHDPQQIMPVNETGVINVIDLANIFSCSFLATSDIGRLQPDGSFEILGRMDNSDIRGCNLLIS